MNRFLNQHFFSFFLLIFWRFYPISYHGPALFGLARTCHLAVCNRRMWAARVVVRSLAPPGGPHPRRLRGTGACHAISSGDRLAVLVLLLLACALALPARGAVATSSASLANATTDFVSSGPSGGAFGLPALPPVGTGPGAQGGGNRRPVVLIPGAGGSQIQARWDRPSVRWWW